MKSRVLANLSLTGGREESTAMVKTGRAKIRSRDERYESKVAEKLGILLNWDGGVIFGEVYIASEEMMGNFK